MSILYEKINELCEKKSITGYRLCKDIGMSPNVLTELKMGRREGISTKNLDAVSKYFNVSIDYLLGNDKKEKTTVNDDGLTSKQRELIEMIKNMSDEELAKKLPVMKQILDI